jgi:hypothetical protein
MGRGKRAALRTRVVTQGDRRALEAEGTSVVQIFCGEFGCSIGCSSPTKFAGIG